MNLAFLPPFHALLNTLAFSLVLALISIKKRKSIDSSTLDILCDDMFFYFFIILCCLSFYHSRDKIWRPKWRWRAFTIRNIRGWFCTACVFVHSYQSHCIGSHQFTFYSLTFCYGFTITLTSIVAYQKRFFRSGSMWPSRDQWYILLQPYY